MTRPTTPTRNRLLGRLAVLAEQVESVLGLPPLPIPPMPESADKKG